MLDLRKRLMVTLVDEGNDYIKGRVSGIICACQTRDEGSHAVKQDKMAGKIYYEAYVFPWEYRRIKKCLKENNYDCKLYYN